MPVVDFPLDDADVLTTVVKGEVVPSGAFVGGGLRVRRIGGDPARYGRDGSLLPWARFELGDIPMAALSEVFGLHVDARLDRSGTVAAAGVQVSLDGGATYLAWNGMAWAAQAAGGTYNTPADFNDRCATLPVQRPGSLGFRVQLESVDDETPVLWSLRAHVEWDHDPHVDVFETIRAMLEERFRVPLVRRIVFQAAANNFILNDRYVVDAGRPIRVYNLTVDPNRNADVFAAYDPATRVVTLDAVQPNGSDLQVEFRGSAPVHVVRRDETVNLAELPITFARVGILEDVRGRDGGVVHDSKLGGEERRVRIRQHPVAREVVVDAMHGSANPRDAVSATTPLREAFSSSFRSRATGETPRLLEVVPAEIQDLTEESHFSGSWQARFRFLFHSRHFTEVAGVRAVQVMLGSTTRPWRSDEFEVSE